MRILIAEDDYASRVYLNSILSKYGSVKLASNGIEALDAFFEEAGNNNTFDLICLDIMMPKVDGIKVYKSIREEEERRGIEGADKAKILITSALADTTDNFKDASGSTCYLVKPITVEQIREALIELKLIEVE